MKKGRKEPTHITPQYSILSLATHKGMIHHHVCWNTTGVSGLHRKLLMSLRNNSYLPYEGKEEHTVFQIHYSYYLHYVSKQSIFISYTCITIILFFPFFPMLMTVLKISVTLPYWQQWTRYMELLINCILTL